MITPMKKATVLCVESARGETVEALRALGLLHVVQSPAPAGGESAATAARIDALHKAQRILAEAAPQGNGKRTAPRSERKADDGKARDDAAALAERVLALDAEREAAGKRLTELRAEEEAQEAFGEFDPDQLRALAAQGAAVSLFRMPRKMAATPTGAAFLRGAGVLRETGSELVGYVLGSTEGDGETLPEGLSLVAAPARRLSAVRADIHAAEETLRRAGETLAELAAQEAALKDGAAELETTREFQRVGESLAAHGAVASLDGFLPVAAVPALEKAAQTHGWALWVRDPEPGEKVPVSLTLPRWLRPVTVLFQGLGILPGYREIDASAVFLAFFSVFFAMIVGDAGYGALLLLAVLGLRRKFPKADARPFWLFGLFAAATLVWGALTGSWFAIEATHLPAAMRGLPWLKVDGNVMWICFLLGAVHLTIANLWNALVLWPDTKALAQVGWALMNWTMLFVAGQLVTGRPFPALAGVAGGVGLVLIIVFMLHRDEIKKEFINYPMLALNLVSALVDVMSYIRLFAVGMASAKIALNFNQMAMGLALPAWVKPLPALLVLLLGHGLNIVLGALSILVHAVRLNTLEFSTHVGLTWSGEPYRPFGGERG